MKKILLGLILFALPALAQEQPTAYQAMRTMGNHLGRQAVEHVIAVSGTEGNPQPETWKILLDDPHARGGVRELEVSNNRVVSERTPLRSSVESSLGAAIDTAKLNLDSSGAYTLARQTAATSHVTFARVDYLLRVDARGNPIWRVTLTRENGEPAGTIFIGANHGTVTRTEGLFTGGDRAAMARDENAEQTAEEKSDDDSDDDQDQNVVKRRIKQTFYQVRDDVQRTFYRVRRSFLDFFEDK